MRTEMGTSDARDVASEVPISVRIITSVGSSQHLASMSRTALDSWHPEPRVMNSTDETGCITGHVCVWVSPRQDAGHRRSVA